MDLGLDVEERDGFAVLSVRGEVDVYTAPRFRERLIELVSEGKHQIIVDLEGVDFLDSTGLGVLVGGLKRLRSHDGDLLLVCTQSRILKVFEITGLTKVFSIHDSVDAAVGGGSDGGATATGKATSTLTVASGAATMKMISKTSMTSTKGVTLISAF